MKIDAGQVAVVTGAASGIGLALAQAFVQRGLRVAMSDVEGERLDHEVQALRAGGAEVAAFRCDVGSPEAVDRLRDGVLGQFGQVDIVCNNAGVVVPFGPLWEVDPKDWEWILDVNLRGVFNGLRSFTPLLVAQGRGHVVNTASMAGVATIPFNGAYNATKHAVVSLTETLHADLARVGSAVGATALCCGLVRTRIQDAARNRPAGQQPPPTSAPAPAVDTSGLVCLEPMDVALQVLDAIERQRLYLYTNPGSQERVRSRVEHLLRDFE